MCAWVCRRGWGCVGVTGVLGLVVLVVERVVVDVLVRPVKVERVVWLVRWIGLLWWGWTLLLLLLLLLGMVTITVGHWPGESADVEYEVLITSSMVAVDVCSSDGMVWRRRL